jgi:hypothetical protein
MCANEQIIARKNHDCFSREGKKGWTIAS